MQALLDCRRLVAHHSGSLTGSVHALVMAVLPAVDALRSQTSRDALALLQVGASRPCVSHWLCAPASPALLSLLYKWEWPGRFRTTQYGMFLHSASVLGQSCSLLAAPPQTQVGRTLTAALESTQEMTQALGARVLDAELEHMVPVLLKKAGEMSQAGRETFLAAEASLALTTMAEGLTTAKVPRLARATHDCLGFALLICSCSHWPVSVAAMALAQCLSARLSGSY